MGGGHAMMGGGMMGGGMMGGGMHGMGGMGGMGGAGMNPGSHGGNKQFDMSKAGDLTIDEEGGENWSYEDAYQMMKMMGHDDPFNVRRRLMRGMQSYQNYDDYSDYRGYSNYDYDYGYD